MKKAFVLLSLLVSLTFIVPAMADKQKGRKNKDRGNKHYQKDDRPRHYGQGYRHKYHGKRHHRPRGHYRGHWRSWREWEDYRRHHRREYKRHRYYREGGSLYFEFETEDGRFVFSIGR